MPKKLSKKEELLLQESIKNTKPLTKESIVAILKNYPDIPVDEMWDKVMDIQSKYFIKTKSEKNFTKSHQEYIIEAIQFFDGYIVSFDQNNLVADFIFKIRRLYMQNESKIELDSSSTEPEEINPANYKIQKLQFPNDIISFQEVYTNKVTDVRTKINTTIYNDLFSWEHHTKLLECFNIPFSLVFERTAEDMHYFIVSALIYLPMFGTKSPFQRFSNKVFEQKRVNKDKEIYINSVEDSTTSFFIITAIDREAKVFWARNIFGDKRLYPVVDISISSVERPEELLFGILFMTLLPVFHTPKKATVYIHNGGTLFCAMPREYQEQRYNKLKDTMNEENFDMEKVIDQSVNSFIDFFDQLIARDFDEVEAGLIKNKFIGDMMIAKYLYAAVKIRQQVVRDNNGNPLKPINR